MTKEFLYLRDMITSAGVTCVGGKCYISLKGLNHKDAETDVTEIARFRYQNFSVEINVCMLVSCSIFNVISFASTPLTAAKEKEKGRNFMNAENKTKSHECFEDSKS